MLKLSIHADVGLLAVLYRRRVGHLAAILALLGQRDQLRRLLRRLFLRARENRRQHVIVIVSAVWVLPGDRVSVTLGQRVSAQPFLLELAAVRMLLLAQLATILRHLLAKRQKWLLLR